MSANRRNRLHVRPLEDRLAPAVFTVDILIDENDGNFAVGDRSLREMVAQANALAGVDVVDFSAKLAGTITLKLGEIPISEGVAIKGPGASVITVSGAGFTRIFNTQPAPAGAGVAVSGLSLTDGKIAASGGAIVADDEALTLNNCVLKNNFAGASGGAVAVLLSGSVAANSCTFASNSAGSLGGAVLALGTKADTNFQRCTLTANSALEGGAVHAENRLVVQDSTLFRNTAKSDGGAMQVVAPTFAPGLVVFVNSTVSGNTAGADGGGLAADGFTGAINAHNSTFFGNQAIAKGGAMSVEAGLAPIYLESCILQGDKAAAGPEIFTPGEVRYKSTALFNPAGIGVLTNLGGNLLFTDCKLGPLANNGGPTQTHRLLIGSPAINVGLNALALANDQRGPGFPRVVGAGPDMGAYERGLTVTFPTVTAFTVNDGSAQRSMVTSLQVKFSESVSFVDGSVRLVQQTAGGDVLVPLDVELDPDGAAMIVHWKLPSDPFVLAPGGSLPDGKYELELLSHGIVGQEGPLDGDGDGSPGGDYSALFHRLLGDADGDADVDVADYGAFRAAFGTAEVAFDTDGDGDVDAQDYGAFRRNFGASI